MLQTIPLGNLATMSATPGPTFAVGWASSREGPADPPTVYWPGVVGLRRGSVLLVPHRSEWRVLFEEEAARLRSALGGGILRVEHVGSTAVEGMEAKPLIDMMAAVESLEEARGLVPVLETMGYEHRGDGGVRGRIFLAKGPRSRRTHHLSLAEPTGDHWRRTILFRDHLRAHPEAAEEHRVLKRKLARRYPEDRDSYTVGKDRFTGRAIEGSRHHSGKTVD